jgi:hypothetical protein
MTPSGDCVHCYKIERARQIAAGEIKRARDIVVGDVICPRFGCFKIETITIKTVEITSKGKVVINKGMGYRDGEDIFYGEQWIDICIPKQDVTPEMYDAANLPAMGGFH